VCAWDLEGCGGGWFAVLFGMQEIILVLLLECFHVLFIASHLTRQTHACIHTCFGILCSKPSSSRPPSLPLSHDHRSLSRIFSPYHNPSQPPQIRILNYQVKDMYFSDLSPKTTITTPFLPTSASLHSFERCLHASTPKSLPVKSLD